jgi:hypothetical protein
MTVPVWSWEETKFLDRVYYAIESEELSGVLKYRTASVRCIFPSSLRLRGNHVYSAVGF